ncbi:DUF2279 domain-containing protein [Sphingobacteriales bacterium UPWRP_1]|nr:hypothetical protein B6N25_02955 [Sphingobacteriales bacterium TSM_CSS]PSJ76014.1 DUF2279 domain-containing protein [Sphingobacteriales bacterium UPWRP_1]
MSRTARKQPAAMAQDAVCFYSKPPKPVAIAAKRCFVLMMAWFCALLTYAQPDTTTARLTFIQQAATPNKARIYGVAGGSAVAYAATMIGLNKVWYAQYPRGRFRFFNDNGEWNQVDKIGHAWTAYSESLVAKDLYQWAGVPHHKAAWVGGAYGFALQMGIEVLDGFSEKWGASVGDIVANTTGSALAVTQELLWKEQRIRLKFSSGKVNYSQYPPEVRQRARELYGTSFQELLLKDYNGQSYWLSVNPRAFMGKRQTHFPKWLNIAVGYGAEGLLGGFENVWQTEDGTVYDYRHISRQRVFYLSPDIDLSRIKTRSKWVNTLLTALNVLKIPAPAISFSHTGKVKGYWLYW